MIETDISKADKSRIILAWIEDESPHYAIIKWCDVDESWLNYGEYFIYKDKEITAWEYVFKPPKKKGKWTSLFEKLDRSRFDEDFIILLKMIVDKLENADK